MHEIQFQILNLKSVHEKYQYLPYVKTLIYLSLKCVLSVLYNNMYSTVYPKFIGNKVTQIPQIQMLFVQFSTYTHKHEKQANVTV